MADIPSVCSGMVAGTGTTIGSMGRLLSDNLCEAINLLGETIAFGDGFQYVLLQGIGHGDLDKSLASDGQATVRVLLRHIAMGVVFELLAEINQSSPHITHETTGFPQCVPSILAFVHRFPDTFVLFAWTHVATINLFVGTHKCGIDTIN